MFTSDAVNQSCWNEKGSNDPEPPLAAPKQSRLNPKPDAPETSAEAGRNLSQII
jgi:hypothetical protein